MSKPVRLQRRRNKGFRLVSPNGLPIKYVGRPSRFGNPFPTATEFETWLASYREPAAVPFAHDPRAFILNNLNLLRGKNLSCWCSSSKACHADILLNLANEKEKL